MTNKAIPHGKLDYLVVLTNMTGVYVLKLHGQDVVPVIGGSIKTQSSYSSTASGELNLL